MFRPLFLAIPLILTPLAASAPAPAVAAYASTSEGQQSRTGEDCSTRREHRRSGGRTLGSVLGGMSGFIPGHAGTVAGAVTTILPVGDMLGEAFAAMLDCDEQQKAAQATEEAVTQASTQAQRGGGDAVGTTANWESTTRPGVTGSSTVTAVETASPDGDCMTVTDVVIIDGQETTAPKRMCRRPPNNRYVRV